MISLVCLASTLGHNGASRRKQFTDKNNGAVSSFVAPIRTGFYINTTTTTPPPLLYLNNVLVRVRMQHRSDKEVGSFARYPVSCGFNKIIVIETFFFGIAIDDFRFEKRPTATAGQGDPHFRSGEENISTTTGV
jgi:hypothetical protein